MNARRHAAALAMAGAALALAVVLHARAAPRFIAHGSEAAIVLHDEDCALKDKVTNLPLRASWHATDGKVFEGCWGVNGAELVMFYFDDRTVVAVPRSQFERIGRI